MDKLFITCATAWDNADQSKLHAPKTIEETADSVRRARDAGATASHVHAPYTKETATSPGSDIKVWRDVAKAIRERTDIIYEHGQGGTPFFLREYRLVPHTEKEKQQVSELGLERPELIALALNALDFSWGDRQAYNMATRAEWDRDCRLCRDNGVKPSFEIWHAGSFFNLEWLANKGAIDPPYWLTLFFAGSSGMSGPATIEELQARVRLVPKDAKWQIAVWSRPAGRATVEQSMALIAHAIALGGNVRIGMEDGPYYWDGVPADSNAQLVERVVRIGRELGREPMSPAEGRKMVGLPAR